MSLKWVHHTVLINYIINKVDLQITKIRVRKHEGAFRLSTWGTYCICVHVCLPTHPWILSWGKNGSTGLKVRLKKCSSKPNATWHSNINRVGWLPGLILHGSFLLTSQITSKTLRALELTFRAGSLSDQLPTVKVLALQWTHWSHFFFSIWINSLFLNHPCTRFTSNGIF